MARTDGQVARVLHAAGDRQVARGGGGAGGAQRQRAADAALRRQVAVGLDRAGDAAGQRQVRPRRAVDRAGDAARDGGGGAIGQVKGSGQGASDGGGALGQGVDVAGQGMARTDGQLARVLAPPVTVRLPEVAAVPLVPSVSAPPMLPCAVRSPSVSTRAGDAAGQRQVRPRRAIDRAVTLPAMARCTSFSTPIAARGRSGSASRWTLTSPRH